MLFTTGKVALPSFRVTCTIESWICCNFSFYNILCHAVVASANCDSTLWKCKTNASHRSLKIVRIEGVLLFRDRWEASFLHFQSALSLFLLLLVLLLLLSLSLVWSPELDGALHWGLEALSFCSVHACCVDTGLETIPKHAQADDPKWHKIRAASFVTNIGENDAKKAS